MFPTRSPLFSIAEYIQATVVESHPSLGTFSFNDSRLSPSSMAHSTSSRSSTLHRICQIASEIQLKTPYSQEQRPRSTSCFNSPDLDVVDFLPYPGSLTAELEASGIDTNTAEKLSTAYTTAATRLKGRCELFLKKHYRNPNVLISPNSVSVAEMIITRKYHSMLRHWKQATFETAQSSSRASSPILTGKSRPTFNHESVPLLERYFDYNAYPSTVDRGILAEKTGLTHRQIEVWFQNHRNRAKKTGRPRTRLAGPSFLWDDAVDTSRDTKLSRGIPPEPATSELPPPLEPVHIVIRPVSGQENILETFNPSKKAFPTPFSSSQSTLQLTQTDPLTSLYDPNEWYRRPAYKPSSRAETSVETLCDSFQSYSNLRLPCQRMEDISQQDSKRLWYPATYTHLYPSHHPALLRLSRRRIRTSSPPLYSFRKPVSCLPSTSRRKDGFLRYCHQPSTFTGSLRSKQNRSQSLQLRRRTSASSVDSSVGCLTPPASPSVPTVHLLSHDTSLSYTDVWDKTSSIYSLSPVFMRTQ